MISDMQGKISSAATEFQLVYFDRIVFVGPRNASNAMHTHNYNKDLDPRLFGRESTDTARTPADATRTQQKPAAEPAPAPKAKTAPEFRVMSVKIEVPADGLKKDQPFAISGSVQPLVSTLTRKKIRIDLIARYQGAEDRIGQAEADIDSKNHFTGTCKQLFYHDGYQRDKAKPTDAKFTLEAKASGAGAEKEVTSKPVELPMVTSTVLLKKGKYDDAWVKDHAATHPASGKEYIPDNKVKKLQENLFTFRLLPQNSDDGFFGKKTEAAVKKFQELAGKPERKKTDDVKIVKIEKITFNGTVDGIVGEKTEKEIAVWLQNNLVKPDTEFRKGDYDDNGVKNKCGERGNDNHHPGTGITEFQKDLAAVDAYKDTIDGCFGEKTEEAVKLFQNKASKGEMVDDTGIKAEIKEDEWLKGHRTLVGDGPTVLEAKKAASNRWKIGSNTSSVLIRFVNHDHKRPGKYSPLANVQCACVLDGKTMQKTTDNDGIIEIESVSKNTENEIRLSTDNGISYKVILNPGDLDKCSTIKGIAQRLRQLGLLFNKHEDPNDPVFQIALKAFQGAHGLEQTGKINASTQQKIESIYGV
jgi:peptidoglycan hydrolase-like protein with peptidoglycan-binding domain